MASPSGQLAAALQAKDAEAAAAAFEAMRGSPLDARTTASACNLFARFRKNLLAWEAFDAGRSAHGVGKLIGQGLSLNALLYACCREASTTGALLPEAMATWRMMPQHDVKPDGEPAEKLLLANLTKHKYDDAFGVFLGAIDAELQPSASACGALVRTCAVVPRLAQSAYAVQLSMKAAGHPLPATLLGVLMKASLSHGTAEQCLAVQADLDALGEPADAERTSRLAAKCAEEGRQSHIHIYEPTRRATISRMPSSA